MDILWAYVFYSLIFFQDIAEYTLCLILGVPATFSDASKEELLCYKGSNDTLEIAANLASAEKILNVEVEDSITVEG